MTAPRRIDTGGIPRVTGIDGERRLLEAATLRRRQLCAAFLHGTTRSWRVRRRIWPAALAGALLVAIGIAALVVAAAFARQQEIDREQQGGPVVTFLVGAFHSRS